MNLTDFFACKPLIGMVHLGPLPGSPRDAGDFEAVLRRAVADARALETGGMDAVMVENFHDAPFHKTNVPPHTVAAMTRAVLAVREAVSLPVGVNVLRNDACAALAVAHVCGARFIRCNVYVGAAVTDQGLIEGAAREVVACRRALGADVWIWADVGVKHAVPLGDTLLGQQARDAVERGLADALIVTGPATGTVTPLERVREVKEAVPGTPVLVGSGLNADNAAELLAPANGAIVGSSLKMNGDVSAPVDEARVRALVQSARKALGVGR
jgi:membrane complex biogenesis BtpA family protein